MVQAIKENLWSQFGASIDMLENALVMCPEAHWDTEAKFWYNAYHCLFFLDYYLSMNPVSFSPPSPFTLSEFGEGPPERVYTQQELLTYLGFCRNKCRRLVGGLTSELMEARWINESRTMNYSVLEILLYNMRHVQHHAAQLNMILRNSIDDAPTWVRHYTNE